MIYKILSRKKTKHISILNFICFFPCSYAEVRAERRRELGIEESLPEIAADKVCCFPPWLGNIPPPQWTYLNT